MTRYDLIKELESDIRAAERMGSEYVNSDIDVLKMAIEALKTARWIPVKTRPMTDEEKEYYSERTDLEPEDFDCMYDCPLPDDGETVLITDILGNVETDTFCNDCYGCYFECNCDMEDVIAWMPLPEPYKESEGNNKN